MGAKEEHQNELGIMIGMLRSDSMCLGLLRGDASAVRDKRKPAKDLMQVVDGNTACTIDRCYRFLRKNRYACRKAAMQST